MANCAVIGGGLSGLSTAFFLSRLPQSQIKKVYLYEANGKHFGGCFLTRQNPQTGALHDLGPHSARISAPSSNPLLRLISGLGFAKSDIYWLPTLTRYIYCAGALRPVNLFSLKTEPPFSRSHLSLFLRRGLSKGPGPLQHDVSVDEFLRTRFDAEFADYVGSALMRGVCGVDSKRVSASAFLNHMINWEKEAPNVVIGAVKNMLFAKVRSVYPEGKTCAPLRTLDSLLPPLREDILPTSNAHVLNFTGGMQVLTDRLVQTLSAQPNVELKKDAYVCALDCQDKTFQLDVTEGKSKSYQLKADAIFVCTPARQMGTLLSSKGFIPSSVSRLLSPEVFSAANIAVAALEFDIPHVKLPNGFGHLLPLCEDDTVMGVVYDSCCSPLMDGKTSGNEPKNTTRFTVMLTPRADWLKAMVEETSFDLETYLRDQIIKAGMNALKKHLGLKVEKPCFAHVGIWRNSIPTYSIGHLDNIKMIRSAISDRLGPESNRTMQIVGSALDGVGISDCVKSAVKAVDSFLLNPIYSNTDKLG